MLLHFTHSLSLSPLQIRDMKKAELAVGRMMGVANSSQKIELFHLDLADLRTVDTFAQSIKDKVSKVHILVNNAGRE